MRYAAQGSKEVKAARLRLNDELDRDTGNSEEAALYGCLSVYESIIEDGLSPPLDPKAFKKLMSKYKSLKPRLEAKVGHPVHASVSLKAEKEYYARDDQLQQSKRTTPPQPICSYDWKDSYWASRTKRQLREICGRREMPGS